MAGEESVKKVTVSVKSVVSDMVQCEVKWERGKKKVKVKVKVKGEQDMKG